MADSEQAKQQFGVQRIYIKDASFESPLGSAVFSKQWQPKVSVDLNTKSSSIGDDLFEVVLMVTVTATMDDETALLIEVQQGGIYTIKGIEGEQLRQALGIMAPNMLFPYLREAVDSLAVKGGFPPIGLQPVNFEALYRQAEMQAQQAKMTSAPEAH